MKHHFVPVGYLKKFTDLSGFLYQAAIDNRLISRVHPRNTCFIDDYYDLPDDILKRFDQNHKRVLELKAFKQFEDHIGAFSEHFKRGASMFSIHDHVCLVTGYIHQKQRTPYYTVQMEILEPALRSRMVMDAALKLRTQFTEQFKNEPRAARFLTNEFWDNISKKAISEKQNYHHTQLTGLIASAMGVNEAVEEAVAKLFDMQIAVLCAPVDEFFFTSDNPGYTLCPSNQGELESYNTNFGTMQSITYPINSKQALYIYWDADNIVRSDKSIFYHEITKDDLLTVNQTTTNFAYKKIYCVNRSYLEAFVESYPPLNK